jgi:outer membrane receptor protein involved in Fe transport
MKKILFTLLITCAFLQAAAHNGTIKGTILDSKQKFPLEYAQIRLDQTNQTSTTDMEGVFKFSDLEEGNHTLQISILGYAKKEVTIHVTNHETSIITVLLEPDATSLKEVKIVSDQKVNTNLISTIDINTRPVNTAQDILRIVPGLFIAQHAGGGKAEQIFLRGFDCDHGTDINLSVDGMPVNMVSHAHGQGYADLHFVIPETIEKVHVKKGPYNASIGDFSTAGAIQFQTKNRIDQNAISMEAGRFGHYRLVTMLNLLGEKSREKNQNLFVAGEFAYRKGFFENPDNLNRLNLFAKYTGAIAENQMLSVQVSNFSSFWNASGQIPERAVADGSITRFGSIDNSEGGKTSRFNANMTLSSRTPKGDLIKNQLFFSHYKFDLFSNFTFYKNDSINGDEINQTEDRNIYGYKGSYNIERKVNKIIFNTELGIQLRYDDVKNSALSNVQRRNLFLNSISLGDIHQLNASAYIDENIDFGNHFRINAGLRSDVFSFDYNNKLDSSGYQRQQISKAIICPKLNFYYTPSESLQFFLLTGKSFHSNDTRVVVAQNGQEILPAAYGAEIGSHFKPVDKMYLSVSLWGLYLKQEFVYVGDEAVVEASGASQRVGIDLGVRYDIASWLYADADFNYARPRSLGTAQDENKIPLAPTVTSIGGLTFKIPHGIRASCRYRYLGDRAANEDNSSIAKGYTLFDGVVEYSFRKTSFSLAAENILNVKWNEAQFETESRLKGEPEPVTEIHYTAGTPFFLKAKVVYSF